MPGHGDWAVFQARITLLHAICTNDCASLTVPRLPGQDGGPNPGHSRSAADFGSQPLGFRTAFRGNYGDRHTQIGDLGREERLGGIIRKKSSPVVLPGTFRNGDPIGTGWKARTAASPVTHGYRALFEVIRIAVEPTGSGPHLPNCVTGLRKRICQIVCETSPPWRSCCHQKRAAPANPRTPEWGGDPIKAGGSLN